MTTLQALEQVKNRSERVIYEGALKNYQLYGNTYKGRRYQMNYEQDPYSQQQNFLYKRALNGLNAYSPEEIASMHWQKKKRIIKVYTRTQKIFNMWKQEILIEITNKLLGLFHNSSLVNSIKQESSTTEDFTCTLSFKDLGINKEQIVNKLIKEGILPKNFYSIA